MDTPFQAAPRRTFRRSGPSRAAVITAIKVSAVVGTILNLINQAGHVAAGGAVSWPHAFLNYLVPFCVSLYSAWRSQRRDAETPSPVSQQPE